LPPKFYFIKGDFDLFARLLFNGLLLTGLLLIGLLF